MENFNFDWGELAKNTNYTETQKKVYEEDTRFWKLSKDTSGKGAAIIRLLPDKNNIPFVSVLNCALKEYNDAEQKTYWYIRDLPSSIKQKDPLNELWSALYNHSQKGREEAKNFSRRETFIANILVVKDPFESENNGKIFLWKFGKKLLEKFMNALNPSEQERELGEKPKPLFNPLEGNNIALKIKKVNGFPNYDDTSIAPASKAFKDENEAMDAIKNKTHNLKEFISPEYFESYDDLRKDLVKFCKRYTPKALSQEEFENIVAQTLGEEFGNSYTPKTTTKTEKVDEAKVKETKQDTKNDNIDDLLDDLDL